MLVELSVVCNSDIGRVETTIAETTFRPMQKRLCLSVVHLSTKMQFLWSNTKFRICGTAGGTLLGTMLTYAFMNFVYAKFNFNSIQFNSIWLLIVFR